MKPTEKYRHKEPKFSAMSDCHMAANNSKINTANCVEQIQLVTHTFHPPNVKTTAVFPQQGCFSGVSSAELLKVTALPKPQKTSSSFHKNLNHPQNKDLPISTVLRLNALDFTDEFLKNK